MSTLRPDPETVRSALVLLEAALGSPPRDGLPEEIFLFVSRLTPLVNVDLIIHDDAGRCLLTWRHDAFYGPGWHVPGGIIRFKESMTDRIAAVAANELGARVASDPTPLGLHEITHSTRDTRGHFLSLPYACRLLTPLDTTRRWNPAHPRAGDWAWHSGAPDDLIAQHHIYRPYLD